MRSTIYGESYNDDNMIPCGEEATDMSSSSLSFSKSIIPSASASSNTDDP